MAPSNVPLICCTVSPNNSPADYATRVPACVTPGPHLPLPRRGCVVLDRGQVVRLSPQRERACETISLVTRKGFEPFAWGAAVVVAAFAMASLDYHVRDPDSVLYGEIGHRLAAQPVSRWIAPEWPPEWYRSGLFQEHPAGLFLLPALLTRLGYPGEQAGLLAGAVYQALGLMLVPVVASAFADGAEARALAWLLQLLPIAFTFRVRANHEPAVLLFFLVALWGMERAVRGRRDGTLVATAGLVALMLVKGLLVVPALFCCFLWVAVRRMEGQRRWWPAASAPAGAFVVLALVAAAYEQRYRAVTGVSFVSGYFGRSLSVGATEGHDWTAGTLPYNLLFYSGRVLWFAFPWSLVLVGAAVVWFGRRPRDQGRSAQGLWFALGVAVVYVGLFSLSTRRAERYIFPAYFVVGAAGAVAALRRWPAMRSLAAAGERLEPWTAPLLWLLLFGLHLATGRIGLPSIQMWKP